MSLNNNQILPERVRNMRQMSDVINAEDIVLEELERIIDEMYQRASLLHEELVNEAWLERKLEEKTGADVKVTGYAEKLLVEIVFEISKIPYIDMANVRAFLNKWLPAHLMYSLMLFLSYYVSIKDEHQVEADLTIRGNFFPRYNMEYLLLDGTWKLDGIYSLSGYKSEEELYPASLRITAEASAEVETSAQLTAEQDAWYLDGTVLLDGSHLLNAEAKKYEL